MQIIKLITLLQNEDKDSSVYIQGDEAYTELIVCKSGEVIRRIDLNVG